MSLLLSKSSLLPSLANDLLDIDRFFTPRLIDLNGDLFEAGLAVSVPSVNIKEGEKEFTLELAAPGLERKDFNVAVDNGVLTISAEKKEEVKEEKPNYKRREFAYQSFSRSFTLPENVLSDKIDAKYTDGILRIALPKKEATFSKPVKQIKVA